MKAEWTRDEVDRIEDAAYNAGLAVGERVERERIVALLLDGWEREDSPMIVAIKEGK
jgi:hypothetical protein